MEGSLREVIGNNQLILNNSPHPPIPELKYFFGVNLC